MPFPAHSPWPSVNVVRIAKVSGSCSGSSTVRAISDPDASSMKAISMPLGHKVIDEPSRAISASGLSSLQVGLTTGTGDVQAGFTGGPASLSADTSTGDVSISVPAGQYAVHAQSTSGQVDVSVPQDPDSPAEITVKVGTGDAAVSKA